MAHPQQPPERTPLLASDHYPGVSATSPPAAATRRMSAAELERQQLEDEAFARRLAEMERADASYQAAEGKDTTIKAAVECVRLSFCLIHAYRPVFVLRVLEGRFLGPHPPNVGQPARAQVRNSMISSLFTQARVTAISFWAVAAMNLPQVALIGYYSTVEISKFNSCDRPISLWLMFHGLRLLLSVIVAGLPLWDSRRFHPYTSRYRRLTDTMNMMGLVGLFPGGRMLVICSCVGADLFLSSPSCSVHLGQFHGVRLTDMSRVESAHLEAVLRPPHPAICRHAATVCTADVSGAVRLLLSATPYSSFRVSACGCWTAHGWGAGCVADPAR